MRIEGDKQTTGEGEEGLDDEGGGCDDGGDSDCGALDGELGADVDESGVEGVEVGAGLDGAGACVGVSDGLLEDGDDAGGKTQLPARSKPRGQLTVGEGDADGDGVDGGLVTAGESEEVAGSEDEGEDGSLVGGEGVGEVVGGSVVEGGLEGEGVEVCGGLDVGGGSVVEGSVGEG